MFQVRSVSCENAVYQVDDSAFVMFTETSEVLGEGFKESLDEL